MIDKYWEGKVAAKDDFNQPIINEFIDGKTNQGPWAIMTPSSWLHYGCGKLGTGFGQRYEKREGGRWLKVEG
jgi:hypothetical protein